MASKRDHIARLQAELKQYDSSPCTMVQIVVEYYMQLKNQHVPDHLAAILTRDLHNKMWELFFVD